MCNTVNRKVVPEGANRHLQIFILGVFLVLTMFLLPIEAKSSSHLGQKIQDHVMLIAHLVPEEQDTCSISGAPIELFRVFPDGTENSSPFQVPNGKILVITDVEWSVYDEHELFEMGSMIRMGITIGNPGPVVFESSAVVQFGAPRTLKKNEYLTTGIQVGENGLICPFAFLHRGNGANAIPIVSLFLRGYLINAPQ